MSKGVSGQDMEDMLSSVRRLVSSELPGAIRPGRDRVASRPRLGDPGALVLTEAQRVVPPMAGQNPSRKSLEDRIAELEAAVSETDGDWEPDGSEDQDQHRPDRIVFRPSRPIEPQEPGDDAPRGLRRRSLRLSEIALIETGPANDDADAPGEDPPAFRHDGAPLAPDENARDAVAAVIRDTAAPDTDLAATAGDAEAATAADMSAAPAAPAEPEDDTAALEEAISAAVEDELAARVIDAVTEDADFDEALAAAVGASSEAETGTEAELVAEPAPEPAAVQEPEPEPVHASAPAANEDVTAQVPDTQALRVLVSELIREELQGELGERITRNVRKLVRQEINRALSARDLD